MTNETDFRDNPLPVYNFGDGRWTLTDGHTRAYAAYLAGIETIHVIKDEDDCVTQKEGQFLYRTCIGWCEENLMFSIEDFKNRVISESDYKILWIKRCSGLQDEYKNHKKEYTE